MSYETPPTNQLRKNALGLGFIIIFMISAAGPLAAVSGGLPLGMLLGNGAGTPFLLLCVVVVLLIFAAGYTAMARFVTRAGGFYSFVLEGFGRGAGGAAAALALLAYNAMQIGLYGLFGVAAHALSLQLLGIDVAWWVWSFLALGAIGFFGYRQIDLSAKILGLVVAGEYLVVLFLDALILTHVPAEQITFEPFTIDALFSGAPAIGILFCFASFVGFEAATIYSEEVRNPERNVPLATYISILLIGCFYAFSTWCLVAGTGPANLVDSIAGLEDPTLFTFVLAETFGGPWLSLLMSILFVTSVFAALLAFHNSAARYFFSTSREGLLHEVMSRTHPVHQSPHIGSVAQTIIAVLVLSLFVIADMDPILTLFSWLGNLATLCIIVLMALTSFSVLRFFSRNPRGIGLLRRAVLPLIAALILSFVFVTGLIHFDLLLGDNGYAAWILPLLIPLCALLGFLRSIKTPILVDEISAPIGS